MANNPYVNKVVFGSATLVDLTGTTATADKILQGYGAFGADGAWMDGTATSSSSSGAVWQDAQGYVHLSDEGDIPLQTKSVSPSETAQTVTPDAGYYALDKVNVGAVSSTYVGSGITRRSSTDLTASGATVTVPSGYYSAQASKAVSSGSAGTPTASKGTVSNHAISVTPSVTNTTGYITGGTKTGTAVSVSASELVSGTKSITENGTGIDVTNYASVDVAVPTGGGSSYTPISVGVLEVTANVTSTSVTTITTSLTIDTSSLTNSKMLYVKVRDKAGKRNNYFYGTDIFFPIWDSVGGGTTQSPAKQVYRVGSSGVVSAYTPATTTCYGVYVSGITDLGEVYVMGRYNSSYSLTINGTYSIDVYMLEWPDDVSPMV